MSEAYTARESWSRAGATDRVLVHSLYDVLKGTNEAHRELYPNDTALYEQAKLHGNVGAAYARISRLLSERTLKELAGLVDQWIKRAKSTPLLVFPRSNLSTGSPVLAERGPANVLAVSFAQILSDRLGCVVDEQITQRNRIVTKGGKATGRTKLNNIQRLLLYPQFGGHVVPGAYILVDDVVTLGATLAALRSHIVRNGGLVIAMTALGNKNGQDMALAVKPSSLAELRRLYGPGIDELWRSAARYRLEELTDQEARFLLERPHTNPNWRGLECGQPLLDRLQQELRDVRD